ncbi:MAG: cytochrome b5 domain-containing protein [Deltaproteobacteria bacterium]
MKVFTEDELKQYDRSQQGKPIYFAYKGKVYDITASPLFLDGLHFEHYAGTDLTDYMSEAPHKNEVFEKLRVVGEYKGG